MARVLYGGGVADMRGKWNGQVHSRNKGGAYTRTKVTPINPNTSYQSTQRTYTAQLAQAWPATLTAAQRAAWTAFGKLNTTLSVFGNKLILSGIAAYQQVNRYVLAAGGTRIDNPPVLNAALTPLGVGVTGNHIGPVLTVQFTNGPFAATKGLYVYATPPLSPGITNYKSYQRFIGYIDAAANNASILTLWQTRFGTFPSVAGQMIGISVRGLDKTTGAVTAAVNASTLII